MYAVGATYFGQRLSRWPTAGGPPAGAGLRNTEGDGRDARVNQFFGSAFPGLCGPEVTSSLFGPPCLELAAARGSNGSSCTVPSVIRVVLMPVSGSKWIDWIADSGVSWVGFGLAATFALVGVAGFSAVPTGAGLLVGDADGARIDHSSTGAVCFFTNQNFIAVNNGVSGTDVAVAALV